MTYDIYHKTEFHYQGEVTFSHNIARLKPFDGCCQKLLNFRLESDPEAAEMHSFVDIYGNTNHHLLVRESHNTLALTGRSTVVLDPEAIEMRNATVRAAAITCEAARKRLKGFEADDIAAKRFLFDSELIPRASSGILAYVQESFHPKRPLFEAGEELMRRIFADFEFMPGFSDISTPVREIFAEKKGVCQDFAHFAIAAVRAAGFPARYVSGYIETVPPKGKEKLFGADASHAWFSLYIPGVGWADFDPTNDMIPSTQHILLGYGRDYADISPLKGVVRSSGSSDLEVMVDVRRKG